MLRDVVKLGAITAVGLGVVATVGVGVGIATLVVGVIFAGVSSAEDEKNGQPHGGSTPKMEERKLPKQAKPASPPPVQPSQEKRASETTKQATPKPTTTDTSLESKSSDRPTESKSSLPNNKDEHKAPISPPPSTNAQPKPFNRTPESKTPATNNRDDRKAATPTPNRQRSSSVLVKKPGDSTASSSSSASKEGGAQRIVSPSNGVASQGKKPSPLSPDLEAQIAPEVKEWKNERPANHEPRKRGTATGRGSNEKRSSSALQAKTETVPVAEPAASVNLPGPLPLFPPSPIPRPKSKPHLSEPIVESQSKPESTPAPVAEQIKEDKAVLAQDIVSPGELSLSKPGDRLSLPARNSQSEAPVSSHESEARRDLDVSPSSSAVASAPVEQSAFLPPDAILAATASSLLPLSMKLDPEPSNTSSLLPAKDLNNVVPNGFGVLQGPASASRDSLPSIQQRNSKITSAAKKVKHTVKRVFKGPDGKAIIHSTDPQRLTSSSSDSIDSQRIFVGDHDQGRTISKLASESRESVASTKSRRSLIDGTKKGLKRMFKGSSDNIEVPPVPPLPIMAPAAAPEPSVNDGMVVSESAPAPKPGKSIPVKVVQQADAGNNVSPLLKEMFKGRKKPRGRR